jgi:hypothetical protein
MRNETRRSMRSGLKMLTISAVIIAGATGAATAQYAACPAGYIYAGGVCQPSNAYSNPVSGAVSGTAAGAAAGSAAAGPVGGLVGGALGVAGGTVTGTTNAVTGTVNAITGGPPTAPAPACPPGYMLYNGGCYPAAR